MSSLERDIEELEEAASSEYERQRVPAKALKGPSAFWGMYAGEHTAGTEFMIGPLFVKWGADAFSLIVLMVTAAELIALLMGAAVSLAYLARSKPAA